MVLSANSYSPISSKPVTYRLSKYTASCDIGPLLTLVFLAISPSTSRQFHGTHYYIRHQHHLIRNTRTEQGYDESAQAAGHIEAHAIMCALALSASPVQQPTFADNDQHEQHQNSRIVLSRNKAEPAMRDDLLRHMNELFVTG
jgi:hypothetical protein